MPKFDYTQLSFIPPFIEGRKINDKFLRQIDSLLDWNKIEKILNKYYHKGESVAGRKAYPAILLFKMILLQTWYGLSDYEVEDQVNDRISFIKFCGLRFEDAVPDHSSICRFRKALTQKKAYDKLLKAINDQLETRDILVKQGTIIDASITPSPRKPRGKKVYELEEEAGEVQVKRVIPKGVDEQGSWTKKAGKLYYGYKKHYLVDKETSLVLTVSSSTAKEHDSKYLEKCLAQHKVAKGSEVLGDKGYFGAPNRAILEKLGLKDRIQRKGVRGRKLTYWERVRNKLISKDRYRVERVFGGIKKWFKSGICRYVGLNKTHSQHVLEAIAYNLKISPGIIMSKGII